ncbi:uncharacterized protein [Musca autumnalis]|uniref:uncharacterized protein n=1 Tax=Musca autumnalis TaxID=221902 RepID=UPI003CFB2398
MNFIFTMLISFTLFTIPSGQPTESSFHENQQLYASLYKDLQQAANKIEQLIVKSLPQLPQEEDYKHYRVAFQDFLKQKRIYDSVTTGDECVRNTKKFLDELMEFISYFILDHPQTPVAENVVKICNENGMEAIKADLQTLRSNAELKKIEKSDFEKYITRNC